MNVSREIEIMQFHLENPIFIDGFVIKSGMNVIKRITKGGSDYAIYHSSDFSTPYTNYPLDHMTALMTHVWKKMLKSGMVEIDESKYEVVEIKSGNLKIVSKDDEQDEVPAPFKIKIA